jgi:GNAT superfamily N-acetyltransferase
MGPETPLRLAAPTDVAVVTGLIAAFRDFLGSAHPDNAAIEANVATLIDDRSTEYLLIGDPETGFAQSRFRLSVWTGTEDAWLEDVFVEPGARGSGLGRTLVEAGVERARARGCGRIQLDCNRDNEAAIRLYESLGFTPIHNRQKWGDSPDLYFTLQLER